MLIQRKKFVILQDQRGFSLIELPIAMLILALILTPLAQIADAKRAQRKIQDTMGFQNDVKDAIDTFYVENKRYLCPAGLTLGPNDPEYGKEQCVGAAITTGSCNNGICRANGLTARPIISGAVPFIDLKLAETRSYDRW